MSFDFAAILNEASQAPVEKVEMSTGFDNIPEGSVISVINVDAKWQEFDGVQSINLQWEVTAPESLKGRKVFQTLKVYEKEFPVRMLMGIYYQALKKPYPHGNQFPAEQVLRNDLQMKGVNLNVAEWEFNGKTGNWFNGVSKYDEAEAFVSSNTPKKATNTAPNQQAETIANFDKIDNDIPF